MASRNRTALPGSKLRSLHHPVEDSSSRHPHRVLTLAEVRILEDRIAAQRAEIEAILLDNQRLATSHVAIKHDIAAVHQEIRRLSATASSATTERDAQVREVQDRSQKLEAEARSIDIDGLAAELDRVRSEIKELRDERAELTEKLNNIESDKLRSQPELQEFYELKAEIEAWEKQIRRGRAAIEYERKMGSNNSELSEAMKKHKNTIAGEAEKLCSELANAERRAMAAVIDPVLSGNQGSGYASHQPGYGGNSLSNPHAIHQVAVPVANQGPGYAIYQPGYGGSSFSDPHVVHQVTMPVVNQGPGYAINQPEYNVNPLPDPHVVHQVTLPVAKQGPGYAINQPEYNGTPLPDPHVVHQVTLPVDKQGPGYTIKQPEYSGNSLPDPHVVHHVTLPVANQGPGYAINEPEYNGNPLPDPHVVHQGKTPKKNGKQQPNKKRKDKVGNNEDNAQGKKLKCQKCKKRHVGECLFGKKVCFRCKQPGHNARDCALSKREKPEKERKAQEFTSTT